VSTKDTFVGTTKRIVSEIVGDGRLAEEGARQVRSASGPATKVGPPQGPSTLPPSTTSRSESPHMDETQFASLLGRAALKVDGTLGLDEIPKI